MMTLLTDAMAAPCWGWLRLSAARRWRTDPPRRPSPAPLGGRDATRRPSRTVRRAMSIEPLFAPAGSASVARDVLAEVFGYGQFRGPQEEIVDHVAAGGDALVLMPTGGGKSLCYQVPAIVRHRAGHGVAVVVSPLIALMQDQVGALEEPGFT